MCALSIRANPQTPMRTPPPKKQLHIWLMHPLSSHSHRCQHRAAYVTTPSSAVTSLDAQGTDAI